jgi:hypothetical protein
MDLPVPVNWHFGVRNFVATPEALKSLSGQFEERTNDKDIRISLSRSLNKEERQDRGKA